MSKSRLDPRAGRGPRQETRIPRLAAMVRAMEVDAKGQGSRWCVIGRRRRLAEEDPHIQIGAVGQPCITLKYVGIERTPLRGFRSFLYCDARPDGHA